MPVCAQGFGQLSHLTVGQPERIKVGQLAADVHVDPDDL